MRNWINSLFFAVLVCLISLNLKKKKKATLNYFLHCFVIDKNRTKVNDRFYLVSLIRLDRKMNTTDNIQTKKEVECQRFSIRKNDFRKKKKMKVVQSMMN